MKGGFLFFFLGVGFCFHYRRPGFYGQGVSPISLSPRLDKKNPFPPQSLPFFLYFTKLGGYRDFLAPYLSPFFPFCPVSFFFGFVLFPTTVAGIDCF